MRAVFIATSAALLWIISSAAYAQSCQTICQQYYDYAARAGASGTYGPLVRLYNQCMACQRAPARREVRCPPGYEPYDSGNDARCYLINCPQGTVRDWDGSCIDASLVPSNPEE